MKILVIDEEFPYPLNSGKRIRTFHLTRYLADHHDVSYLAYGSSDSAAADSLREHRITPYAVVPVDRSQQGIRFYLRLALNLFSRYPYVVTSHYTPAFQSRLERLIAEQQFDLVVCEWTPYAIFLRRLDNVRSIIVAHNIESEIWRRYQENETNPLKRWYISIQRAKVERFERNCFEWADGATTVSEPEAETLRGSGITAPVAVIENGVDVDYFQPGREVVDDHMLVFTGSMDWRPNQDAAIFFVREIFPLLRREQPRLTAVFVGRRPPRKVLELADTEGIVVTGTVDDVRPYIARAGVYIVPLRIGGGSRLKILEAMAMGKAVVSTSVGAEGLRVEDGVDILLGDTPQQFTRQVIDCLNDEKRRQTLAERGRQLVQKHYRWEQLGERYHRFLMSVAGKS
ncbi:MAG: glycosyltransferase [bacterium]